jgi:hypothetical protein
MDAVTVGKLYLDLEMDIIEAMDTVAVFTNYQADLCNNGKDERAALMVLVYREFGLGWTGPSQGRSDTRECRMHGLRTAQRPLMSSSGEASSQR